MPRTAITATALGANGSIVNMTNAGGNMSATDDTNGNTISIPTTAIPAGGNLDRLILLVLNTNGTGRTLTVRGATSDGGAAKTGAGTASGPSTFPSFEGAKGDITFGAMTLTTGVAVYGPFEVARFLQPDGTISIDYSGATGFIKAILLPRAF